MTKTKYAVIIIDGAADHPCPEIDGKTPLEVAQTPALKEMAHDGTVLSARTVPDGFSPGSDVANLSVFGYDPKKYYTGRAPLEAASIGITLDNSEAVYRANTVTITDGIMKDYAGGHISTEEAEKIISFLDKNLEIDGVKLHLGTQYRHACVIKNAAEHIGNATPPHDILDQPIDKYMPKGGVALKIMEIMEKTNSLLRDFSTNKIRLANGKLPITQLWLWGGGIMPQLPSFNEKYGIEGGLISAVDLLKGIATLAKLEVIEVEGATGFYDTNYQGKCKAALKCLETNDFVAIHIEAPDEAGHNANLNEKIKALENIDRFITAPILEKAKKDNDLRIMIMPDHPTPIELRTHTSTPVPACIWGKGIKTNEINVFSENAIKGERETIGHTLLDLLIKT